MLRSFVRCGEPASKECWRSKSSWNSEDPVFDRDLANFKRLHAEGAICVGIDVTRGASLQRGNAEPHEKMASIKATSNGYDALEALGVDGRRGGNSTGSRLKRTARERNPLILPRRLDRPFCQR